MIKFNFYFYWMALLFSISMIFFYFSLMFIIMDYSILLEWKIYEMHSLNFYYLILLDWISCLFISVVLFISSMVILYSMNYMGIGTYSSNRFLFLVILFVFSMLLMIVSPNLVSILLGWDGLGLVSYCLVIYYNSMKSYLAGMITCLTNRLGDIGLLVSIAWMMSYGSWHFMFYLDMFDNKMFYLLMISSFTKSAQIPFSTWLPAAMAAPTPVSALVHSSTLVTAGVYLLIRFFNAMVYNNMYFIFISMMTMFMSSFCANYEFDLKKIIALSTLSQLGLMMSSLFLGLVDLSFFHLLSHAMFKSLLFLCAGLFIYYMNDNQDIRVMGSVCMSMPFTTSCFNISNLALCGIPFLSGFYSKDLILETSIMSNLGFIFFIIFFFCLGLTCSYSIRLFYYSMLINSKFKSTLLFFENKMMKLSILILCFFSVTFGCAMLWMISINMSLIVLPFYLKVMPLMCIVAGIFAGSQIISMEKFVFKINFYLFSNMWFMFSYSSYLYQVFYQFSFNYKNMMNWGELYGPMGISNYLLKTSNIMQIYSLNNLKITFLSFLTWILILI
uniref:NADH dehydrogenase subunit 5 n=1 Tax=Cassianeura bimaculata TaxID=2932621 RepID=UPI001FF412E0|nr:NADH dehydrogenase subunit 5 [Cassianeura bimaculata]UOH96534.1 NADH dehydrogenase subunit 5 [Cassianeura bimaculata]